MSVVNTFKNLTIKEIHVDYNWSSGNPVATFSIGNDLRNVFVKVKCIATTSPISIQDNQEETYNLNTNTNGYFSFPIPLKTVSLEMDVIVETSRNFVNGGGNFVKLNGVYHQHKQYDLAWRTYDGCENNLIHPEFGKRNIALLRKSPQAYADGNETLAVRGPNNPNPRLVSNKICKSTGDRPSSNKLTDMVWGFCQFIDHEVDLTEGNAGESADFLSPSLAEDASEQYPERTISFTRSKTFSSNPREQPNEISSFIDGTNVYGSDTERAFALRMLDGSGKLKLSTSDNNEKILIFNDFETPFPNAANGQSPEELFLAGDVRANENILLMGMHVLFAREHNRMCDVIVGRKPEWFGKDELIFQHARRFVVGMMANILYKEVLPSLIGSENVPTYKGYDESINPGIMTEFSTVGYRLGHSMLSSSLKIGLNNTRLLRDSFFNPTFTKQNGIDSVLQGAANQVMQEIDGEVVDDIRDFLFGAPTNLKLLDLAALNIQRGRDHGIPSYNAVRHSYGLSTKNLFSEITSNEFKQIKLQELYGDPDHIDPWVGCLVEDHVPNCAVGETLIAILKDQFIRLRDGDRFYFENDLALTAQEKDEIRNTKMSHIIIRNTKLTSSTIQNDVFHLI